MAEEAGVRLALHPDDPNDGPIGGVARIFSSFEGFERASQAIDSPAWGLLLCIGCWTEMGGTANVLRGIRHFGPKGRIVYVHFRDIEGTASNFSECFVGQRRPRRDGGDAGAQGVWLQRVRLSTITPRTWSATTRAGTSAPVATRRATSRACCAPWRI